MPKHSRPAYAILLVHTNGKREFLPLLMGLATAATRDKAKFMLREWKRIARPVGVKAKVVRVVITES